MVSKSGDRAIPTDLIPDGSGFSINYKANSNNKGGTFTVSDGAHAANMALLCQYTASSFDPSAAGFGTLVHDPALEAPMQMLTPTHHA